MQEFIQILPSFAYSGTVRQLRVRLDDLQKEMPAYVRVECLVVRGHNKSGHWWPIRSLFMHLAVWILRRDGLTIIERKRR